MIERVIPYVFVCIFLYWAFLTMTIILRDGTLRDGTDGTDGTFFVYSVLHSVFYLGIGIGIGLFYSRKFIMFVGFIFKFFILAFYLNIINKFNYFVTFKDYSLVIKSVTIDLLVTLLIFVVVISVNVLYCILCILFIFLHPCIPSNVTNFFERKHGQVKFQKCFTKLLSEPDDVCCICLVEFDNSTYKSNVCDHIFHMNCIQKLILNDHKNCPLCKQEFGPCKIIYKV
jgi:hypothetical protein